MTGINVMRGVRIWVAALVSANLGTAVFDAQAAYTAVGTGVDGACAFNAHYSWAPPAAGGNDNSAVLIGGPNWTYDFSSPDYRVSRDLNVRIVHEDPAPCDVGHGVGETISLNFPNVQQPPDGKLNRVVAKKIRHGLPPGAHNDFVVAHLTTPVVGARTIFLRGEHVSNAPPTEWSFVNLGTGTYSNLEVTPSYRDEDGLITYGGKITRTDIGPKIRTADTLASDDKGNLPTNYTVSAYGSPATHSTLAFLGEVEGIAGITELELGPMIDLFGGFFLAPVLREKNQSRDLFVFIDLTLYLSAAIDVVGGAMFDFVDGVNDGLPGISVFTSPFLLGSEGLLTGVRFSGSLVVDAAIDGSTIPAPATLALLAPCLLLVFRAHRRRTPAARSLNS